MPRKFLGGKPTVGTTDTPVVITTDKLSALAATTSAELAGVISDETGSGALVFGTTPTIATPALTLSTTTSTADGRIAWDATNDDIIVGTGAATVTFGPLGSTNGAALGAAAAGTATTSARADHVHPTTGVVPTTSPVIVADFSKSGTLATGTGTFRWYNDSGATLTIKTIRASCGTAPSGTTSTPITGASLVLDVNIGGTTIWSTAGNRVNIQSGQNTGSTSTFNTTTIANGGYFTVDIDYVGSTAAGADLTVSIWLSFA